jgi:hypothetical protein
VTAALAELSRTAEAYAEAQAFYEGTAPEVMTSRRLRELLGNTGQQFRINYARTPVDVLVERTMIQGIMCKDAGQRTQCETVWSDNELGLEAKDLHRRAYEFGDAYLIAWPDEEMPGGVSAFTHDPTSVRVFYDPEQPRRKSWAVHNFMVLGNYDDNGLGPGYWQRVNLYYPDRVEQYVSQYATTDVYGHSFGTGAATVFVEYETEGEPFPIANPVPGVIPVFHFRTARPYGRPEHADAFGPQNGINKILASMMAAIDYQIGPQRYALTDSALDDANPQPDPFGEEPVIDPESGLNMDSDMESGPGTTWLLSGKNVRVGQFDPADMQNFLLPKNDLVKSMAAVTDLPIDRYEPGGDAPSGESRRMAEIPLNKKTSDRFAQFGVTWREFFLYCLAVNSGGTRPDSDVQVAWAPPETYSDKASWETAEIQLRAGVPYEQVLLERGYSSELVVQWAAQRAAATPVVPTADVDVST